MHICTALRRCVVALDPKRALRLPIVNGVQNLLRSGAAKFPVWRARSLASLSEVVARSAREGHAY
jgi:hypothetical protein